MEDSKSLQNWAIICKNNGMYTTQPSHPQSTTLLHKHTFCQVLYGMGQNCYKTYI
jgi:hypothetical protein